MPKITKTEILPDHLAEGDRISITMSHQLHIDGDQSWVTYKVEGKVEEGEQFHDAHVRLVVAATSGVRNTVHETVRNVRIMSGLGTEEK